MQFWGFAGCLQFAYYSRNFASQPSGATASPPAKVILTYAVAARQVKFHGMASAIGNVQLKSEVPPPKWEWVEVSLTNAGVEVAHTNSVMFKSQAKLRRQASDRKKSADNGGEFSNVATIENDVSGRKESSLFFVVPISPAKSRRSNRKEPRALPLPANEVVQSPKLLKT
jgi:hypothetical protein